MTDPRAALAEALALHSELYRAVQDEHGSDRLTGVLAADLAERGVLLVTDKFEEPTSAIVAEPELFYMIERRYVDAARAALFGEEKE